MKKIAIYILLMFCAFSVSVLSACNQDDSRISFNVDYIEMNIGDELDVYSKLNVKGVAIQDVTLKSLDSSVISLIDGKATAVGQGTTFVQASYDLKIANLEIKVNGEAIECEAPMGLMYDTQNGFVTWNHVLVKIGNEIQQVNSYTVEIKSQNTVKEEIVIGDNKYQLKDSGVYEIRVKCNSFTSNGTTLYQGSEYSQSLVLTKLEKPYNLKYNDETKTLSWEASDDIATFVVNINGVLSQPTTKKEMVVDLTTVNISKQETFEVSVISQTSNKDGNDIVASSESDKKVWTRLYAPQLNIANGVITWDNTQQGDFHYEIIRTDINNVVSKEVVSGGVNSLDGISAGTYNTIQLKAVSDSENYLSSENLSVLSDVIKLEKATLSFNPINKTFVVENYEGKNIELEITYKNSIEKISLQNGTYLFDKTGVGAYSVKAYVYAQDSKEINADASNTINLLKLSQIDSSSINQSVNENKYFVTFGEVENADTYSLSYFKDGLENTLVKQADGSYGDVDTIFNNIGTYQITITASSSKMTAVDTFILPSKTTISVVRQENVSLSLNEENGPKSISWNTISTANGYSYYILKNGELFEENTISSSLISVENFEFGKYEFFVKAVGSFNSGVLYLDSLNYAKVDFEIELLLDTPTVNFDVETKILTITKVNYANNYEITINLKTLSFDNSQDIITIDLTQKLQQPGDYVVEVKAVNADNDLIFDSNTNSITIIKLSSPQQFNLSMDGVITILDYPNGQMLDENRATLLINDEITETLDDGLNFVLKAKFNATKQKINNHYYLDSEWCQFNIQRLIAPTAPVLNETVISWQETTQENFVYLLTITQGETVKQIQLNENQIDVFDERISPINTKQDFSVKVCYLYVGANINLQDKSDIYFTSQYSEETTIHKIESDAVLSVVEEDEKVLANWTQSSISDVSYELLLNDEIIYSGNETSKDITEYVVDAGKYTLKLKISKQGFLTSEYVEVYVERLASATSIKIDEDENIIVETNYNTEDLPDSVAQLDHITISKDQDQNITNLSSYFGNFEISVGLVAKKYTEGKYYFLSSAISTFEFSRIQTLTDPTINNNIISWDDIAQTSNYKLKFSNGEQDLYYLCSGVNYISAQDENIKQIIDTLNSGTLTVSVSARVGEISALIGQENLLSSYYSNTVLIIKLNPVSNIILQSEEKNQQEIKISWDYDFQGVSVGQFVIEIYKNDEYLETIYAFGTSKHVMSAGMTYEGTYYVKIYAEGTSNCINSDTVASAPYKRLAKPQNLTITQDALLTFTGVAGAVKYGVSYYANDLVKGELETLSTSINLKEYLFASAFSGQITINVYSIGGNGQDEGKTFSSQQSDNYIVTKPVEANITLSTNKLVAGQTKIDEVDDKSKYVITISTDNRIVKELELNYGEEYIFEDWYYKDTNEKVPTNVEKVYSIKVERKLEEENCIKSDSTLKIVTKLAEVNNVGFIRKTDSADSTIYLRGDVVANASKYVLNFLGTDFQTNEFNVSGQYAELALLENIYSQIPQNFTMTVYAQGLIGGRVDYIDSSKASVSGKKLSAVTNFKTVNGVLCWDKVDEAYDYAIDVNNTEILTGYVLNSKHTLSENLNGKQGELVLNIKAVGNVKTSLVKQDIVLDSLFITNEDGTRKDYSCKKLAIPQNLKVVMGYIAFTKVEGADGYQVVYGTNNFNLDELYSEQTDYSIFYAQEMYNMFKENQKYSISVMATSTEEDVIYSDKTQDLSIKILSNNCAGTLNIVLKQTSTNPVKYDYTISQLIWTADSNAVNGYNVNFNGEIFNTKNTEFVLDGDGNLEAGRHQIKLSVAGSSEIDADGSYLLNSKYSETLYFTKLSSPNLKVENGELVWDKIDGATGYLLYLGDELQNSGLPIETNTYYLDLSNTSNTTYSSYKVRAISTSSQYIASSVGTYKDAEGNNLEVVKLHSPDAFMIKEGAFRWELNDIWSLLPLVTEGIIENPVTATTQTLATTKINMKFASKTSTAEFSYEDYALKYCFVTDKLKQDIANNILIPAEQKEMILALLETYQYNGWPTLNNGYLEMGADLPAGAYNLTLRQKGDSVKYLTSNYGSNIEVYVPYAPQISIVYSNNAYVLSWNSINIPASYNMQTPTYVIFADQNVEEEGKIVSKRVEIGRTTSTSFNITNLVESGTINSSFTAIYVYVAGNDDKVLNGKISNKITLTILDPTTARVRDGVIYWNAQESASAYQVTYTENNGNVVGETKTLSLKDATWDCAELQSYNKIEEYSIKIQAIGLKVATTTHAIISGPNSSVGKVSKLPTPISTVEDGRIRWLSEENSSSYKVIVNKDDNLLNTVSIINQPDLDNYIWFESTFTEENLLYKFQAVGSLDIDLSTGEKAFVNSNKGSDIYGTTISKVSNVVARKGVLYWDIAKNNNINISYYKLTFNQVDNDGNPINEDFVIINNNFTNADGTCSYNCADLASGRYRVTIQAFFKSSDNLGTYIYNGETAYYLMSIKSDSYEFQKYSDVQGEDESGVVYNIVLKDGEFTWKYVGNLEEENYQYELKFKINEDVTRELVVITEENSYFSYVTNKLINENPFELQIRVIPKDGVEGFVNSNYVTFVNPNNKNLPNIYQLNGISADDIVLRDLREEDIENIQDVPSSDLHIIWNKYSVSTGDTNIDLQVKYKVNFWTSEDETVKSIIVDTMYINTLEFQSTISDEYTLYYTIQVLPLGNQSYIPSCISDVREIQKPQSVQSVGFNSEEKYFYWSTEGTSNDHSYKIKDEIIEANDLGEIVYVDGEPNVLRTYIYTTQNNLTNRYTPTEQGMHKVSVAVVVKNSDNDGSLTSDYTYYYDEVLEPENKDKGTAVLVDLFKITQEGSNGTVEKPYLIETKEQFNNIKYRLQKDEYLNSYTLMENGVEQTVTLSEENKQFNFKQIASIYNVSPLGQGTNFEFVGNYDGNKKTLSWDYDLTNITAYQSIQYVALFSQIASGAKVQNLKVVANLTGQLKVGATISLLCYKNLGTIQNVVLGSQGQSIDLTSNKDMFVYGIAYQNLGTIQNVVNYYDVSLKNSTDVLGIKASFASIAGENEGLVLKCGHYGNITLQTTISTSGGIVGTNRANGTVEACVLKNQTTTLSINKQAQQGSTQGAVNFYFGGIIGQNDGTVNYCYTYTNSVIYRSAPVGSINKVYIAGLVGLSNNGNIKGSYVYNVVNASSAQSIQIGNVYLFAYITWSPGGVDTRCFYNEGQSHAPIGGVGVDKFSITSYSKVPLGDRLNGTESTYYLNNENEFPKFEWENEVGSWVE